MSVRLIGTLSKPPEWRGLGVYLDVELHSIDARPYRGKARLTEFLDDPKLRELFDSLQLGTGDRLEILVKLHRPVIYRNPGVFDYRRHLERQGIYWTGTIRNPRLITVLNRGWHGVDRIRNWIEVRLEKPFAGDRLVRGLVLGMVLGQKHGLTAEAERQFQAGGLYHLVVVSGFNLAVVAGSALWVARRIPWRRQSRLAFVLICTLAYAAIVEGEAPVMRATLMVAMLVAARLLDRDHATLNAVFLTAFTILVYDPTALEESSLQMTFAAVLAIICIGVPASQWTLGWLREALKDFRNAARDADLPIELADWRVSRRAWCELHGLPAWVLTVPWKIALFAGEATIVSLAVEIVFVFFMVESFHRISPISPLMNVPAGVVAALVTPLGLSLLAMPPSFATIPAWLIARLLRGLVRMLDVALSLPSATLRVPSAPVWLWLVYAGVVAILLFAIRKQCHRIFWGSLAGLIGLQVWISVGDFQPAPPRHAALTFLDVGQGDSSLIEMPDGSRILIDGGGSAAGRFLALRDESTFSIGESVVSPYLFGRRIRRLDAVVLTHAHHDHMDGLFDVIENFDVGEVWLGRNPMIPRYRELIDSIHRRGIPIRWVKAGDQFGPFTVLHPPAGWRVRKAAQNDDSVVLLLRTADGSALLTGDIERTLDLERPPAASRPSFSRGTQNHLPLQRGRVAEGDWGALIPSLTVLKVPHHGSRGVRLRPPARIRVISVGSSNPFGHPHPSALPALRTDRDGAITITLAPGGPQVATSLTQECRSCKLPVFFKRH